MTVMIVLVNVLWRYHEVGDKYNLVEERSGLFETDDRAISCLAVDSHTGVL